MIAMLTFRAAGLWPMALSAVVLVTAAMALLYPGQVRSLGPWWRWAMPSLRAAALVAVALSILRPVVVRTSSAEEHGAVLVLLDRSRSMGAMDRLLTEERAPAAVVGQLISLTDMLGWLPEAPRRREVAGLYDQLKRMESVAEDIGRARRELEYARLSGRQPGEAQTRLVAAMDEFLAVARDAEARAAAMSVASAASRQLSRLAHPPDRWTWIRNVSQAVADTQAGVESYQNTLDAQLYAGDPQVKTVCDELSHLSRLQLSWLALTAEGGLLSRLPPGTPVAGFTVGDRAGPLALSVGEDSIRAPLDADGERSDLGGGLRAALAELGRRPIQAVVLISDGRQTGRASSIPSALMPTGVPIFSVYAASPKLRDLSIDRIEMPSSVFVNEIMTVRAVPRSADMDAPPPSGEATLTVGNVPLPAQPLTIRAGQVAPLEFQARLDQPGLQRITLTLPQQDAEASTDNNQAQRWVKVLVQRLKVTVIAGAPGRDFRYLRNTMERTPWIDLHQAVVTPGTALAMSGRELADQDLLILSDVSPQTLTKEQWAAVRQLVRDRGGSVILLPSLSTAPPPPGHVLAELLPYAPEFVKPAWRLWPGRTASYHMVPAPGSENLAALRIDDDPEISRQRWEELPGFYRYLSIGPLKPTVRTLLVEGQSRSPLLTEARLGAGRIFFMAMNETWRWRDRVGGRDQDRFWLQLARYAVDEPYAVSGNALSFDIDSASAAPDQSVHLRARLRPLSIQKSPSQLEVRILRDGALYRQDVLHWPGDAGDGRYVGEVRGLPPGRYELRVVGPADGSGAAEQLSLPLVVQRDFEQELADLSGDRAFLQNLSEGSGGRCVNLDQLHLLPGLLEENRVRQPRTVELPLWHSGYLFLFVLGCLTAEWGLRKRFGMI